MKIESQTKHDKDLEFEEDFSPESVIKIIIISALCMIAGTMVLGTVVGGLAGLAGSWALLFFGWFYILPITIFVTCVWAIWDKNWTAFKKLVMASCVGIAGGILMILIGMKGPEIIWTWGYFVGGSVSGVLCCFFVTQLKQE